MNIWLILLTIVASLLIIVPVAASMVMCAPKWYRRKISPHTPNIPINRGAWYWAPVRWLWRVVVFIVVIVAMPVIIVISAAIRYIYAWTTWVERKCPYVAESRALEWDSQAQEAERFIDGRYGFIGDMWRVAIGRSDG